MYLKTQFTNMQDVAFPLQGEVYSRIHYEYGGLAHNRRRWRLRPDGYLVRAPWQGEPAMALGALPDLWFRDDAN